MPKQSPIPDDLDRPFWEAANEDRLVVQYCTNCNTWQHPPQPVCAQCESTALEWREVSGDGTINSYSVVYDTPIALLQNDMPYNVGVIELDDAPGINMLTHLPGVPIGQVEIGAKVKVVFDPTPATGQKVPEWVLA